MSTYDNFSKDFFPAFWYAMGRNGDQVKLAQAFGNWYIDKCREAGKTLGLIEMYKEYIGINPETH